VDIVLLAIRHGETEHVAGQGIVETDKGDFRVVRSDSPVNQNLSFCSNVTTSASLSSLPMDTTLSLTTSAGTLITP